MRLMRWTTLLLYGSLMFQAGGAVAGDDAKATKRAELKAKFSASLARIAGDLVELTDQPDETKIDDAIAQTASMKQVLTELADVAEGDAAATEMASRWPNYVSRLKNSLAALKRLKHLQHVYDGVPAECRKDEGQLHERIRFFVGHPDKAEAGIKELTERATTLGKAYQKRFEGDDYDGYNDRSDASDAAGMGVDEGEWAPVAIWLVRDATALFDSRSTAEWHKRSTCDRLTEAGDNPDVKLALDELKTPRAKVDRAFDDVKKDYDDWKAAKAEVLKDHVEHLEEARTQICETYENQVDQRVNGETQQILQLHGAEAVLLGRADLMLAQLAKLEGDEASKKQAKALAARIEKGRGRLEAAAKQGLLGFDDPKIRAASLLGRKKHAEMRKACAATNVEISGGNVRLDCVDFAGTAPHGTCTVVMIGPDNHLANSAGENRGRGYQEWLADAHAKDFPAGSIFLKCLGDDDKLKLADPEVRAYDACPKIDDVAAFDTATVASDD